LTSRLARWLGTLLTITCVAAGAVLLARCYLGPFTFIRPVSNPLNAEGIFALCILLKALLPRRVAPAARVEAFFAPSAAVCISAACLIAAIAFAGVVQLPLLHDAYVHIWNARIRTLHEVLETSFVTPRPGDLFFRPVGYLSYWLDYKWAGFEPVRWNLWNIGLHLINTALVWTFARKLCCGAWGAFVAALLFALNGTRCETVAWVGARFDLLATFFALTALLAIIRFIDRNEIRWLVFGCLCGLAGFLSKESSYSLFLLVLLIIPFRDVSHRSRIVKSAVSLLVLCGIVLAFRTWFLHGTGGYITNAGSFTVLNFSAMRTLKALLFRQWAILLFPLNWTSTDLLLKLTLPILLIASVAMASYSMARRTLLATTLLWVIAAVLPAQHLLLIGQDLSGSRILYLPAVGFALFCGLLAENSSAPRALRVLLPAGLVLFQFTALEHNLAIWQEVSLLSQRACLAVSAERKSDLRQIVLSDLPNSLRGVFFLRNGLPQCVAIMTGEPIDTVIVAEDTEHASNARFFKWDTQAETFEPIPR
jgi:hypothetical protein